MDRTAFTRFRIGATLVIAAAIGSLLTWQLFNGGVPSHSFMARDDMPSISNWWGALTLPLLTWIALGRLGVRLADGRTSARGAIAGGLGAMVFGAVLSTAFTLGYSAIPGAQMQMAPLIALFLPIYRAEYLLGFVLALAYTFGGVLPLVIGTVLAAVGFVLHRGPRWLLRRFRVKR
jgi:hypothetical protein